MRKQTKLLNLKDVRLRSCICLVCILMAAGSILQPPRALAAAVPNIFIDPGFVKANPGDNITLTINVTSVAELFTWQVCLKFNGTLLNCTGVWVPENSVFADQITIPVDPLFGTDVNDGASYIFFGQSLLLAPTSVSNGILFKANFTVQAYGETPVLIATREKGAQFGLHPWEVYQSSLQDFQLNDLAYTGGASTVVSGETNARPVAVFSTQEYYVDNSTQLVLEGHRPPGDTHFVQTFADYPILFNASLSYDSDGNITKYIWDFGDGNITQTTTPIITHTYNSTGNPIVRLTVQDNGTPPSMSDTVSLTIVVGLVLQYFNWTPFEYTIFALIALAIAVYVVMEIRGFIRRRNEQKKAFVGTKPLLSPPATKTS